MFYSANGKFTKKSIKEGFLDVFHGYVHKHDETELDKIKSDINDIKDKANDLSDEFKSSKRNFYALYDKVSKSDEVQDKVDQKFSYLDEVQDEIDQKFSYLDEVQDEMEQQINEMNHFEENIGIGTPPHNDYKLDVNGDVRINGGVVGKGSLNDGVYFPLRHSEFKEHEQILMRNNGDIYMGSGKDREITFFNGNPTERKNEFMNMKNGNVGIGTNTPKAGLQVYNNKGAIISSAIASGERTAVLRLGAPYAEDHDAYCAKITSTNNHSSNYNSDLRFYTHDSEKLGKVSGSNEPVPDAKERMSILSNGNVGIGTNNPSALLQINKPLTNSDSFPAGNLKFSTTNGANNWDLGEIEGYVAAGTGGSTDSYPGGLAFKTKNTGTHNKSLTTKMVLDANGNVGIGTTTPTRKLDVNGNVIFRGADFLLDNENRRNGEGGDNRRALVHDTNDQLTINYNNDYKGGVKIGNNMKVFNDGQVNATKFCAGGICLTSADITKIKNL